MPIYNITSTSTLNTAISNYSVQPKQLDSAGGLLEQYYDNPNFTKWFGYYNQIPEIKTPLKTFATWVLGQGYVTDEDTKIILDNITGWGEDSFLSVLWNMLVTKKINGDAYAEIIRDPDSGELLNLKPLNPSTMRIVCNKEGKIIRYEQRSNTPNGEPVKYKVNEIFHICNDRIGDNIHGDSIIESIQWHIDAMNEALVDKRRSMHLSTIRVMEVEEDNPIRLTNLKRDYKDAIEIGYVLLVPKGTGNIQDLAPPVTEHMAWIKDLEDRIYRQLGTPKVILGGTAENTEASAKVSTIVWEPIFTKEITDLEQDIWNQLFKRIKINKQPSLMDNMQSDEAANTGQVGFQQNDITYGSGKA